MSKAKGIVRILRPINSVMMGFAVFVGTVLASPNLLGNVWLDVVLGFLTGFMLTAASMAINDYYDRKIDAINEPSRPIPSGLVSPFEALALALILSVVGFVFAVLVSVLCLIVASIAWITMVTYVTIGKRSGLPGNFLVSACVAAPFIYGSIIISGNIELSVLFFVLMAFLANVGREITKGIVDVVGDRTGGIKTLAVRYGDKTAAVVAAVFYVSAVALTPIPLFLGIVSIFFVPLVLVTDIGLVLGSAYLLADYSRENSKKIKNAVLLLFITGLLAFIVGVVV